MIFETRGRSHSLIFISGIELKIGDISDMLPKNVVMQVMIFLEVAVTFLRKKLMLEPCLAKLYHSALRMWI